MKVEFNNAKFGKTVPMIYPVNSKNKRIVPTSKNFPKDYVKNNNNSTWIDMNSLLKDMYIKVYIKYNYKTNNFVWFIPSGELKNGDEIKFELFEPRLSGYDSGAYYTNNGGTIGYGTENGYPDWFDENSEFNENHVWIDSDGKTEEEWATYNDFYRLLTTATTLYGESLLFGTKLFNENALPKIERIYIDGIRIDSEKYFDVVNGTYKTNRFQLPDLPFEASMNIFSYIPCEPS